MIKAKLALFGFIFCAVGTAWGLTIPLQHVASYDFSRLVNIEQLIAPNISQIQCEDSQKPFDVNVKMISSSQLFFSWCIEKGHYLYRNKIKLKSLSQHLSLGNFHLPNGKPFHHELLGDDELIMKSNGVDIPVQFSKDKALIEIYYQGCSQDGICFPPQHKIFQANMADLKVNLLSQQDPEADNPKTASQITYFLAKHHLPAIFMSFLLFGVLLSFTPCVLPMVPILFGTIVGKKNLDKGHVIGYTFIFVLSVAITYALLGIVAASLGYSISGIFQKPIVLEILALIFVMMALALFDVYTIQLPAFMRQKLDGWAHKPHTSVGGIVVLGIVSALVVSPCVAPPLVGALAYIAHTGHIATGGLALFALGLGMGTPLLLIAIFGEKILPKGGAWMTFIKHLFGFLLLLMALILLERLKMGHYLLYLWSLWIFSMVMYCIIVLPRYVNFHWIRYFLIAILSALTVMYAVAGWRGMSDPLRVGQIFSVMPTALKKQPTKVTSLMSLNKAIVAAKGQWVLVDFYADWCTTCQWMKRNTFPDPAVQQALAGVKRIEVDVTSEDAAIKQLYRHFEIYGPPALLFYNRQGKELRALRLEGEVKPGQLVNQLQKLTES